jgi:putative CocE/NonD family hydrolase
MMFTGYNAPSPLDEYSVYDFCPSHHVPRIMDTGIPVYNIGGWFDTFVLGTTQYYCTMKDTNPSKMTIVPGFHGGGGPYWEYLGEDIKGLMKNAAPELLRFFDRYLKGIDNGFDREPPIAIYVMNGEGWRFENEWPLARQVEKDYYFNEGRGLSQSSGTEGRDRYVADFTHDARWGKKKGNRWLATMGVAPDKLPLRNELDKKCLTYTTEPLATDMEVTGHPIVRLWVSSSADDTDFFVYLSDIDEDGQVVQVTEGVLRAGFAGLVTNDQIIDSGESGVDVKPETPWHGFEEAQYNPKIFADGNIVEMVIDLKPTSWVFRKGHKIRISIACADWPTFRLHPKLSMFNDPKDPANIIPIVTIFRSPDHPSRITLPVIPD